MAEESKNRARTRDEQLIDLEWQINLLSQELASVKEENQVVTADCHKLLAKIQAKDQEVAKDSSKINEVQDHNEKLQREIQKLQEKLKLTREDFKNLNKLRKQENEQRQQSKVQSETHTQRVIQQLQQELGEANERLEQTISDAQQERSKLTFEC